MTRGLVRICLLLAVMMQVGCIQPRFAHPAPTTASEFAGEPGPFAPALLRVHPLTHLERDPDGEVHLLVHIQLRDRWSDICKGVGTMQFALYEPTGLGGGGQEQQALRWEVDLSDLSKNAVLFDPATQTYRFPLKDLPGWVQQMAPGGDRTATGPGRFRVVARLTTPKTGGGQTVLSDELVIGE